MYHFFGFVSRLYTLTCTGRPVSAVFQGFMASTAIYFCNIDVGTYVMLDHVPLNPFNKLMYIYRFFELGASIGVLACTKRSL